MVVVFRIVRIVVGRLEELAINANFVAGVSVQKAVAFPATLDLASAAVGAETGGGGRAGSRTDRLHGGQCDAKEEREEQANEDRMVVTAMCRNERAKMFDCHCSKGTTQNVRQCWEKALMLLSCGVAGEASKCCFGVARPAIARRG